MRSVLFYLLSMLLAVALLAFLALDITWFAQCFSAQAAGWAEVRVIGRTTGATAEALDRACHGE